jgi:hypothetical protein
MIDMIELTYLFEPEGAAILRFQFKWFNVIQNQRFPIQILESFN